MHVSESSAVVAKLLQPFACFILAIGGSLLKLVQVQTVEVLGEIKCQN